MWPLRIHFVTSEADGPYAGVDRGPRPARAAGPRQGSLRGGLAAVAAAFPGTYFRFQEVSMPARSARKAPRRAASRPAARASRPAAGRWSKRVMETSDAMDLEPGVFTRRSPSAIAASLKRSAERSRRRKAGPFQSAMSMLNFYINRGGKNLTAAQKARLEKAKDELRILFGRG